MQYDSMVCNLKLTSAIKALAMFALWFSTCACAAILAFDIVAFSASCVVVMHVLLNRVPRRRFGHCITSF